MDAVALAAAFAADRASSRMAVALAGLWATAIHGAFGRAIARVGAPALEFDPDTPEGREIYAELGRRITGIEETTRLRVAEYVARNRLAGGGLNELARMLREDPSGAFNSARAMTIARTESGMAYNRGTLLGYRQSGRVTHVRVFDGPHCGWPKHRDAKPASGAVVTLDEAKGNELAHPRCRRSFAAAPPP